MRHYASGQFVFVTALAAVGIGVSAYLWLPDAALEAASAVTRNLWIVIGPIGTFCIQILLQLITVGEDKALTARQQQNVKQVVDQRMRYLWDLTAVVVLSLLVCLSADSFKDPETQRTLVAFAFGLASWTGLLGSRLPSLFLEIRDFRWRLARERNTNDARNAVIAALNARNEDSLPEIPEPEEHS